jgi:hypothetical protein
VTSAVCWCGGLVLAAYGVYIHQIWLLWLGAGVIGGIGLGLGYISPVSTLIKWFPDRRGMATGMAIMGFGGGDDRRPLADRLMNPLLLPMASASGRPSRRRSILCSRWQARFTAFRRLAGSRRAGRRRQ